MNTTYTDITSWTKFDWENAYGTRSKVTVQDELGNRFFFKESLNRYPWEFWCEVIASKIGQIFGLDIVDYNSAYCLHDGIDHFGSLSKYIHNVNENESLTHGQNFLTALKKGFDVKKGTDHTFRLIEVFIKLMNDKNCKIDYIIEMIIYDAIIGNRDRHQQNWALLHKIKDRKKYLIKNRLSLRKLIGISLLNILKEKIIGRKVTPILSNSFAPLFDNGSSLGHEIIERNLNRFTNNENNALENYINNIKSASHIRWENEKLNHYDLINNISNTYSEIVDSKIDKFRRSYSKDKIKECVYNADIELGMRHANTYLTKDRKEFIITLVEYRYNTLLERCGNVS